MQLGATQGIFLRKIPTALGFDINSQDNSLAKPLRSHNQALQPGHLVNKLIFHPKYRVRLHTYLHSDAPARQRYTLLAEN